MPSKTSPKDIEVSDDGSLLYFIEGLANNFAVYTVNENKYLIKTKLPPNPTNFTFLKDAQLIAITCPGENEVIFLDSNNFAPHGLLKIEGGPEKILSDSGRMVIYVADRYKNKISIINAETQKIQTTIDVGETPVSLALHPGGKWLYVGNGKTNTINIIDLETNQITDTINLPVETQFPGDIILTPDSKWLIATSETTNVVSIIDISLKKVVLKLDIGATSHTAYILDNEDDKLKP